MYKVSSTEDSPINFSELAEIPKPFGHVISARITSENPDEGFKPTSGTLQDLNFKSSKNVWGYFRLLLCSLNIFLILFAPQCGQLGRFARVCRQPVWPLLQLGRDQGAGQGEPGGGSEGAQDQGGLQDHRGASHHDSGEEGVQGQQL